MDKIEEVIANGDRAIVVFDDDVSSWNDIERKRFISLKSKYSNNDNVVLCNSMPSIEYWFLLHYVNTTRFFGTSQAVVRELVKYISNYSKKEKFLVNTAWVTSLCADNKLFTAISRVEKNGIDKESYSNVWKAMKLFGFSD